MRLMLAVFDAMVELGRPASRLEIQRVAQLGADETEDGLRSLRRRSLLVEAFAPRKRHLYELKPGAERPVDGRGRYTRTDEHKRLQRRLLQARLGVLSPGLLSGAPAHSPACAPYHAASPGVGRVARVALLRRNRGAPR